MEKRFDKLEEKLDKVLEEVGSINVTLARNTSDLEYHIKRTDLAEKHIQSLEAQVIPLKKKEAMIEGVFKLIGAIATALGLTIGAAKLFFG